MSEVGKEIEKPLKNGAYSALRVLEIGDILSGADEALKSYS